MAPDGIEMYLASGLWGLVHLIWLIMAKLVHASEVSCGLALRIQVTCVGAG